METMVVRGQVRAEEQATFGTSIHPRSTFTSRALSSCSHCEVIERFMELSEAAVSFEDP